MPTACVLSRTPIGSATVSPRATQQEGQHKAYEDEQVHAHERCDAALNGQRHDGAADAVG